MKLKTRTIRKIVQIGFLLAFIVAFIVSKYPLQTPVAIDFFTRLSPLAAITTMIASRALIALFIPALVVLGLSALFGRFFCGWVCPLGTTIDISDTILERFHKPPIGDKRSGRWVKFAILAAVLVLAVLGWQGAGFIDPMTLYPRSLATVVSPYANHLARGVFDLLYYIPGVNIVSEAVYRPLRAGLLEFNPTWFRGHILFLAIFLGILLLGLIRSRFWCRYICPLGAMLALFRTGLLLRRRVNESCVGCGKCKKVCPTGAIIDEKGTILAGECTLCANCTGLCPKDSARFSLVGLSPRGPVLNEKVGVTRRQVLGGVAAGIIASPLAAAGAKLGRNQAVIRPPGALPPGEFEARCLRCGECMKVCPTNGLQPLMLGRGLEGLWTPQLVPRIGYCEYNCTLCGAVCPSDAIYYLDLGDKQATPIGYAGVDRNRCLPWACGVECIVCEEHCPVEPKKAIWLEEFEVTDPDTRAARKLVRPHVNINRCIGCGICENKCPAPGTAAIRVRGADADTIQRLRAPQSGPSE